MEHYGYIYKTTNLINSKVYIGQKRSCEFLNEQYLGSGTLLRKALKKYGKENFKVELVEWCASKEDLDQRECYWIEFFNATNLDIGYNIATGGQGGDLGDTCRQAISKSLKGRKHYWAADSCWMNNGVEEIFIKKAEVQKFQDLGYLLGRLPLSDDTKQKISDKLHGREGKGKGSTYYTDGTGNNVRLYPGQSIPEGYYKGHTFKDAEQHRMIARAGGLAHKNNYWWTDGYVQIRSKTSPGPSFYRGRLWKKKNKT